MDHASWLCHGFLPSGLSWACFTFWHTFYLSVFFSIVFLTATVPKASNPLQLLKFRRLFLSIYFMPVGSNHTHFPGNEALSKLWFLSPPGLRVLPVCLCLPSLKPLKERVPIVLFGHHCLSNNNPVLAVLAFPLYQLFFLLVAHSQASLLNVTTILPTLFLPSSGVAFCVQWSNLPKTGITYFSH